VRARARVQAEGRFLAPDEVAAAKLFNCYQVRARAVAALDGR
jgi:hypothetical protein